MIKSIVFSTNDFKKIFIIYGEEICRCFCRSRTAQKIFEIPLLVLNSNLHQYRRPKLKEVFQKACEKKKCLLTAKIWKMEKLFCIGFDQADVVGEVVKGVNHTI